tara:strand:+ start:747 stop:965 length:219 start_codon:yes stop_codon:yes gene_type:complete
VFYLKIKGDFLKKTIGKLSLIISFFAIVWLILGMLNLIPLILSIPGITLVRSHATFAVIFLLIASWAFWNED